MKKLSNSIEDYMDSSILNKVHYYFPEKILKHAQIIEFEDKEFITKMTEPLHFLCFLLTGRAKIYLNHENGKQTLLQFIKKGDFIGELTLVDAEEVPKDVVSIGKTICLAIPISIIEQETINNGRFFKQIAQYIGIKLLARMEHFSVNQSFELKYRLATVILETEVSGLYTEKNGEIADYLGVSYRHYLYVLHQFQEKLYLRKVEHGYLINKEKLSILLTEMKN